MTPAERRQAVIASIPNFVSFCGLLQIRLKSQDEATASAARVPMVLTPLQQQYNALRTSRDIVVKGRQIFFTTLEAARDLWWFLTKPGARVVIVCQSQGEQGALQDISEKFRIFFDSLGRLGLKLDFGRDTSTSWTLPKRDATMRIIQAGGSEVSANRKGAGGTVNRLHFTEMSKWGDYAADTFLSITESVPKNGSEIVNESTARGAGNFFHDQWLAAVSGDSAYKAHFFPWYQHPEYREPVLLGETIQPRDDLERMLMSKGVTAEQIKWRRWKILDKAGNEDAVNQEYPSDPDTCFLMDGRCFFDLKLIADDFLRCGESLSIATDQDEKGRLRIWEHKSSAARYVIGADASQGGGGDASAAVVFERGTGKHVATLHGQFDPQDYAESLVRLSKRYGDAKIAVERAESGLSVLTTIRKDKEAGRLYCHTDGKPGFPTNVATRPVMLDGLSSAHRRRTLVTRDRRLLEEMKSFVVTSTGKAEAEHGKHDDLVMAAAIGFHVNTSSQAPVQGGRVFRGIAAEDREVGYG